MDWHQRWEIISLPDNVPHVLLMIMLPFYTWYGLRQAFANDRLIAQLDADPEMAKTHHRKTQLRVGGSSSFCMGSKLKCSLVCHFHACLRGELYMQMPLWT